MERFMTRKLKRGGYSAVLTLIVIAALVVVNLIAGQMPASWKAIDIGGQNLYQFSDVTKELVSGLDKDVTLYVVSDPAYVDNRIDILVKRFEQLSPHIKTEALDPILHPNVLTQYEASDQSILVSCEATGKTQTIAFNDIITFDEMSYYYYGQYQENEFDGEGQLTSAISNVSSDVVKQVYQVEGHGEAAFSSTVQDLLGKSNLTPDSLNLLREGQIPDGADLLIFNNPASDLADDERDIVLDYLAAGGNVMLLIGPSSKDRPNFESVMEAYGMELQDGYVADVKQYYQNNPYNIFPTFEYSGDVMSGIDTSSAALIIESTAMTKSESLPEGVSVTPFMKTSSGGVMVNGENQVEGTFLLGATASAQVEVDLQKQQEAASGVTAEEADLPALTDLLQSETEAGSTDQENVADEGNDGGEAVTEQRTAMLTVITAPSLISQQITSTFSNVVNLDIFMNAVTNGFDDVQNVSIPAKSLSITYNTITNGGSWAMLFIILIPVLTLAVGFRVWLRRRKL